LKVDDGAGAQGPFGRGVSATIPMPKAQSLMQNAELVQLRAAKQEMMREYNSVKQDLALNNGH